MDWVGDTCADGGCSLWTTVTPWIQTGSVSWQAVWNSIVSEELLDAIPFIFDQFLASDAGDAVNVALVRVIQR